MRRATSGGGVRITAAICPDRAGDMTARAVTSLVQQSLPKHHYEILLIGDADVARPCGVTQERSAAVTNLRCITSPPTESSDVRNLALQLSQAPLVAFLDACAEAEPGWLASYCRTFEQFGEAAQVVGGRVAPLWGVPRPDWLGDDLLADLSLVDLGDEARFLHLGERISGVNFAFRRASLAALGGFPTGAESVPGSGAVGCGNQQRLIDRIVASSGRAIYDPLAAVKYRVSADRLTQQWFRKRAAWRAVSDLMASPSPTAAVVAERWQAVKDFFFECPPTERTIRGLVLQQDDPERFRQQISAVYDSIFCLLSGIGEQYYD
jgi:hypothetical protein